MSAAYHFLLGEWLDREKLSQSGLNGERLNCVKFDYDFKGIAILDGH